MADKKEDKGFSVRDRRYWATGETDEDQAEAPRADRPSFVVQLEARVEAAESQLREYIGARKVEQSDLQDLRERLQREHGEELARARGRVVAELLDLIDDLERAEQAAGDGGSLEALLEGVGMVRSTMFARLSDMGLTRVAALGQDFDPERHEAVSVAPCDESLQGKVLQVVQEGYSLGEQVLRPARVIVGKLP